MADKRHAGVTGGKKLPLLEISQQILPLTFRPQSLPNYSSALSQLDISTVHYSLASPTSYLSCTFIMPKAQNFEPGKLPLMVPVLFCRSLPRLSSRGVSLASDGPDISSLYASACESSSRQHSSCSYITPPALSKNDLALRRSGSGFRSSVESKGLAVTLPE